MSFINKYLLNGFISTNYIKNIVSRMEKLKFKDTICKECPRINLVLVAIKNFLIGFYR